MIGNHAVVNASGIVAAASDDMDSGTLKTDLLIRNGMLGICSYSFLVSRKQKARYPISHFYPRHIGTKLFHSATEVTTKDCSVPKCGVIEGFDVSRVLSNSFRPDEHLVRLERRERYGFQGQVILAVPYVGRQVLARTTF
jgi:hypothetical protein